MKKALLICLDGCSWDYIESADMPNLKKLIKTCTSLTCQAVVPTVTNVNNASILTGEFPLKHGITGNYYLDRYSGKETYMDSPSFLKCETLLAKASKKKLKTLLLTVKDKLRRLLAKGSTDAFSLEKPSEWAIKEVGKPPGIYSLKASIWLLDVAIRAIKKNFDIIYVSTTDYIPHKYAPKSQEAKNYMEKIDEKIGLILKEDITLAITADHGMNEKKIKLDLEKALLKEGIKVKVLPIIKDEYIKHHQNLGGSVYIYFHKKSEVSKALKILQSSNHIESVLTKEKASAKFKLPANRIGDLMVLADKETVFGPVKKGEIENVKIRSHGSLHERLIPFIINRKINTRITFNKDALKILLKLVYGDNH